jgi:DNA-binding Lrp family transcriptional regulator
MRGNGKPIQATPRLDRLDLRILAALQADGRMTNARLAEAIGLSPTPCLQRVRRLEAAGYIKGYGALIDAARLGPSITVFTEITLRSHGRDDFLRFERLVQDVPHIVNCYLVSGGYDYLVQFVARDVAHYQEVIEALVDKPAGIEKYFSYIAIKHIKAGRHVPLSLFD